MARFFLSIAFLCALTSAALPVPPQGFVRTDGLNFTRHGKKYAYIGANLWSGMHLGAFDRPRLVRELDRLQRIGVKNLRVLAATEGPDSEPWRIVPAMQTAPGVYNEKLLRGLDFLLWEMQKRDMTAVIVLGNYWQWSGGFGQYLNWAGEGSIPYPKFDPLARGGSDDSWISYWSWLHYNFYVCKFYGNTKAIEWYEKFIRKVVTRRNTISGQHYYKDPTIMAWQLANEPAGFFAQTKFDEWILRTAKLIKARDPYHLVSVGSMGEVFSMAGVDQLKNHSHKEIDYATVHIWVQNAAVYNPDRPIETYPRALRSLTDLLDKHRAYAKKLNKPLVFEEFGISRDQNRFEPGSSVLIRNHFYYRAFSYVIDSQKSDAPVAGVNFWAWGGEGAPKHVRWQPGDPLIGDPPHEAQGWYSVYADDHTTTAIIARSARRLAAAH